MISMHDAIFDTNFMHRRQFLKPREKLNSLAQGQKSTKYSTKGLIKYMKALI